MVKLRTLTIPSIDRDVQELGASQPVVAHKLGIILELFGGPIGNELCIVPITIQFHTHIFT
jgi:hypothetical protein